MKSILRVIAITLGLLAAHSANAAPVTLTFDTNTSGTSYTENGLTITATSAEPVRTNGNWFLDCCDGGPETFSLTTGGVFDLLSVFRSHVDSTDPVVWKGFFNGNLVATNQYNSGQGSVFNFTGFNNVDLVTVSVQGSFTDPRFDNLVYQAAPRNDVPEPASLAILALGLGGLAFTRRKKS